MKNINTSIMWDSIISDNKLSYFDPIVVERISMAETWMSNSSSVLNIGSGQGFLESKVLKNFQGTLVSSDISLSGLRNIRSKWNKLAVCANVLSLPFLLDIFQVIVCMEVIEHFPKDVIGRVYTQLRSISSKSTLFIFSVPVYEPTSLIEHPVGHYRKFTPDSFKCELEENGFNIISDYKVYSFKKFYSIKRALIQLLGDFRRPSVIMYLCKKR